MRGPVTSLRALKEQTQSEDHDLSFRPALHGATSPPPPPRCCRAGEGREAFTEVENMEGLLALGVSAAERLD